MSQHDRRHFLRSAGAAAALTACPPAIQRALAIAADRRTGSLRDVQHIVILTQENRSFDHYFGSLPGVRGFADRFPVPVADAPGLPQRTVWVQPRREAGAGTAGIAPFALDTTRRFEHMRVEGTPHSWADAQAAWDHGRMAAWTVAKHDHAMGHYSHADLPFQWALANAFTICDAYHCAFQGGTNPNRLFLWTGSNDPLARGNGPAIYNDYDWFDADHGDGGYRWTTYPERLEQAGISWQVYEDMADNFTDNPLAGFQVFRAAYRGLPGSSNALRERGVSTRGLDLLRQDVQAGRLPQVSWIVANAEGSEHPGPSSPAQGADYTARVLDALTSNPEVWSRTVLFVNFDENDGFFDHVPPPAVPSRLPSGRGGTVLHGASTVDATGEYHQVLPHYHDDAEERALLQRPYGLGPRVPMYVISPWSKGGWVNSEVFDHTSVIRFIERRFGVREPNISPWRRAVCGDLMSAFNFADPEDSAFFDRLPKTVARAERARALPGRTTPPTPSTLALPVQPAGIRPSRALPYTLQVNAQVRPDTQRVGASEVELEFLSHGQAAAVFHVYDRLRLHEVPRRYTVEAGKRLAGRWTPAPSGAYDLWVLGPNGFHRHFTGNARRVAAAGQPNPEVDVVHDRQGGGLLITLRNTGPVPCVFTMQANAYFGASSGARQAVMAHSDFRLARALDSSGHWYDFSVRVEGQPDYSRRFAGRVETGAASISDPAMSGQAIARQWALPR
ncbi:phosphocholine-specific phospholipase C [Eleftheria terrae]|uniref:phosphocholine-specific phospholipase C n=1 Tax=Eleftheria terrae TaxID=1597781 RepID=UPI00263ADF74|nr:phospholipase C, phosphocholine-specific [Eleftheria terrae]WKB50576.1 phospholipase C, phosphocholine-specific [Eleftheria terrae]